MRSSAAATFTTRTPLNDATAAQRNDSRDREALGLLAGALEPAPSTNMERTFEFAEEGGLGITFVAHRRPAAAEHYSPRCAEEAAETAAAAAEQGDEASPTARSLVVVMAVLPGSMAARHEGLQPGMVLSSVQGEPVAGETFKPTMKLIKGAGPSFSASRPCQRLRATARTARRLAARRSSSHWVSSRRPSHGGRSA